MFHTNLIDLLRPIPVIYVITPTYKRPEQIAELVRLGQTLLHIPSLHWIVVEDSNSLSPNVAELLHRFAIPYTHLNGKSNKKLISVFVCICLIKVISSHA